MKTFFPFLLLFSVSFCFGQDTIHVKKEENKTTKESVENNSTVTGVSTLQNDNVGVGFILDENPVFPGGQEGLMKYLKQNLKYPKGGIDFQGNVYVRFTIDSLGNVISPQLLKPLPKSSDSISTEAKAEKEINDEAIRVVNIMPKWTPGKIKGKPVNSLFILPIKFRL